MLSAFYEAVTGRAPDMLRSYLLAVLVQMVAVNALAEYGHLQVTIPPFFGFATVLGGFVFGLGMTLAVGCAGAVLFRAGEGKLDYGLAVAGYAVGVWVSNDWLAQPLQRIMGGNGAALTLHRTLAVDRRLVVVILALATLLWVIRGKHHPYQGGWDWGRTGLAVGVVGVAAWATSAMTGHPTGLGTVQGSDRLATFILERDVSALDWSLFLVVGIPLGSYIASRFHGASLGRAIPPKRLPQAAIGGLLMGLGASVAAGDNVAHGLGGVPLLAVGSLTFMVCMFLGVWAGVRLRWL
ncbi:MAG: YeeE/YedE family protein [candidate division NC10 bacterium]|nr:YeeE/YedE family protein [candidate division NC10 bacterium]